MVIPDTIVLSRTLAVQAATKARVLRNSFNQSCLAVWGSGTQSDQPRPRVAKPACLPTCCARRSRRKSPKGR